MPISREQYSRTKTMNLRRAMAKALARYVQAKVVIDPVAGSAPLRFARVFEEWPSYLDFYVAPSACVLPDGELVMDEVLPTPTLLEDTWENPGEAGYGLYVLAYAECQFKLALRAPSAEERSALVAALEDEFVADGVLMDHGQGRRYGCLLTLPEYFGVGARYSLLGVSIADSPETAIKNQWEATLRIQASSKLVRVDIVRPFRVTIRASFA